MDLHLITAPRHAPEFVTVFTEAARIARERRGAARRVELPDTKRDFVPAMNELFAEITKKITFDVTGSAEPTRASPSPGCDPQPVEQAEPRRNGYSSPFSAATTLQRIDASMCAEAIRTMTDGKAIGNIIAAAIERLNEIRGE